MKFKNGITAIDLGTTRSITPGLLQIILDENYLARAYWVNTSDNKLIKDLLKKSSLDFKRDFEILVMAVLSQRLLIVTSCLNILEIIQQAFGICS